MSPRSSAVPAMTAVMPSIARRTNAGTSAPASWAGPASEREPGSSTPVIPASLQRTPQRPSAVSNVAIEIVIVSIIFQNTATSCHVAGKE